MFRTPEVVADPAIPVPPFRDAEKEREFRRRLALHVAEVSRASGGPYAETLALCSVVAQSPGALLQGSRDGMMTPSAFVLNTAFITAFPAPWSPVSLVSAARAVLPLEGMAWTTVTKSDISYWSDPEFSATRDRHGAWKVVFRERGVTRVDAELTDDWALVRYLMDHLVDRFPFPFASSTHGAENDALLRRNARAVAAHYTQHRAPYLESWSLIGEPGDEETIA